MRFHTVILGLCLFSSCAGPMTPFGAISVFGQRLGGEVDRKTASLEEPVQIRFAPHRQVLHGKSPFAVIINDPSGVPDDFQLEITYNGIDVSRQFLSRAERTYLDSDKKLLKLATRNFRVLATRDNEIRVGYRRAEGSPLVLAKYMPPQCSAFQTSAPVKRIPLFEPPVDFIQAINFHSSKRAMNPHYVAGLIAQESSFDPSAVSGNKAMGLTQVTPLGEAELIKRVTDWPRYPGINDLSVPMLRLAIMREEINSSNEWRLNPALSIAGGVEYLAYLNEYWSRPDKRELLEKTVGANESALSEVILASYNSGAALVSQALERNGTLWLRDEELIEARKYVRRVFSFCDHFENQEARQ